MGHHDKVLLNVSRSYQEKLHWVRAYKVKRPWILKIHSFNIKDQIIKIQMDKG